MDWWPRWCARCAQGSQHQTHARAGVPPEETRPSSWVCLIGYPKIYWLIIIFLIRLAVLRYITHFCTDPFVSGNGKRQWCDQAIWPTQDAYPLTFQAHSISTRFPRDCRSKKKKDAFRSETCHDFRLWIASDQNHHQICGVIFGWTFSSASPEAEAEAAAWLSWASQTENAGKCIMFVFSWGFLCISCCFQDPVPWFFWKDRMQEEWLDDQKMSYWSQPLCCARHQTMEGLSQCASYSAASLL